VNASPKAPADQQLQSVAAILARGVLRYHRHIGRLDNRPSEISSEFLPEGLEVLGKTRLSGSQRAGG